MSNMQPGHIEYIETPLSIKEEFKLVVIAHESSSGAVRDAAIRILSKSLNPLVMVNLDS